jgi:hypothetical protein
MESEPGTVTSLSTVSVDMRDAFNTVPRQAVVDAVAACAPALLPFVQWAYARHSCLYLVVAPARHLRCPHRQA